MGKMYKGSRRKDDVEVRIIHLQEGEEGFVSGLLPHIPFHSPSGFEWGYGGSGPADLALAILVDYLDEHPPSQGWEDRKRFDQWTVTSRAWKLHQPFKRDVVAGFDDEWELDETQIAKWLKERKE